MRRLDKSYKDPRVNNLETNDNCVSLMFFIKEKSNEQRKPQ